MSRVRSRNTSPEIEVRRLIHGLGFRFRLHRRDLPGTPDVVLPKLRTVILVHGCFWHRHSRCAKASTPNTNRRFWVDKFQRNQTRDKANRRLLRTAGWITHVIWECETRDRDRLRKRLARLLDASLATLLASSCSVKSGGKVNGASGKNRSR
ncbi:MAG: very short patch repair endonuclease [Hyphomonadaceae bacterium]|nr:very short patch repair endonuclease [Hyphomonadaceae bacterium]